jgi:PAS domain S-box-containing protein
MTETDDPIEARHRRGLVRWLLLAILAAAITFDSYYAATTPGYWSGVARLAGARYAFLAALLAANHFGWTRVAAVGAIGIVPALTAARVLGGLSPVPARTLSGLVLDVVIASLLFSVRGTAIVAGINVAFMAALGILRPSLGLDTVVGYAAISLVAAGLLITGIRHRARVVRERQAQLRVSEARKAAVIETALDCILVIDREGRLVEFNSAAERTFGLKRSEVIGREMATLLVPPEQRDAHRAGLRRYLTEGTARVLGKRIEVTALRGDGTEFPCELAIVASGQGDDLVFTANLRDLTDRKQAEARQTELEEQLRESQKMQAIGQLAGGVAHDFNNTLQAVGGYLTFALEEARRRAPDLAPDLEEAEKATQRAAGLTRQLLAFSRRQVLDLQIVSLTDVIAGFLGIIRRAISERINFKFHPGLDLPRVRVDQAQVQQVILNLCLNARDAMPEGGDLTLETELVTVSEEFAAAHPWARPGTFVVLVVVDSGSGMTPEVQSRMFEPFFSTKGAERGTGLGLAVVYGIIQQHQGFIRVDSAPGSGTSFRIYLPVAGGPDPVPVADPAPPPSGGSETVLIAEDADAIRDVIGRALRSAGYRVVAALNGEEAVRLFARSPGAIDLVVLDAVMPRLGGREALTAMRALRPDLPALFLSGYSADTIDPGWLATVGAELLMKPVAPSEFLRRVRRILDSRKAASKSHQL